MSIIWSQIGSLYKVRSGLLYKAVLGPYLELQTPYILLYRVLIQSQIGFVYGKISGLYISICPHILIYIGFTYKARSGFCVELYMPLDRTGRYSHKEISLLYTAISCHIHGIYSITMQGYVRSLYKAIKDIYIKSDLGSCHKAVQKRYIL